MGKTEQYPLILSYDVYISILMELTGITKEEAEKITKDKLEREKNG